MARSNSYGALKAVGFGAAAIVGGTAIGLLIGGGRGVHTAEQVVQQPATELAVPTAPPAAPPTLRAHTNGNYTAPGAPRIVIREESAPTLHQVNRTAPPPPADTEASQEVAPPVKVRLPKETSDAPATDGADAGTATPTPTSPAPDTAPAADESRPPAPPPAPADPDFERVGKPGDAEAGQEGSKAQFRVQTGSYTDESNARSIADQLRGQGYSASTHSEREGDHMVYKVQAGAYRSKNGANKAAGDLQKKGFPAYVAPVTPQ